MCFGFSVFCFASLFSLRLKHGVLLTGQSYQTYPVNMEVISWLGVWYVKSELYENAIEFFERAAEIEPREVKWKLMVASCHRRMGNTQAALQLYKRIHQQDPDSIECRAHKYYRENLYISDLYRLLS